MYTNTSNSSTIRNIHNSRQEYLDKVRSFTDAPESKDVYNDDTLGFPDLDNDEDTTTQKLREEVKSLKTQVRYLKKMVLINVFESREDLKDFFSDIW